jgi:hypothetical protein
VTEERLSAFDAFFVAYQRRAGIAMHLGIDAELEGELDASMVERAVDAALARWPALGAPLRAGLAGVYTTDKVDRSAIARGMGDDDAAVEDAINEQIDPFSKPSLQVRWRSVGRSHRVIVRVHHAMMDGEGFAAVAMTFFAALAGGAVDLPRSTVRRAARERSLPALLREKQRRDAVARESRHAMLPLACVAPGNVATVSASLRDAAMDRARARAEAHGVSAALWVIAAWARAVHAAAGQGGVVAIEVPVSVRAREGLGFARGNHIAPLVFYTDAARPIEAVARGLRRDLRRAVERGHLEMDRQATALGAVLPWPLFERIAVDPSTTGNATSHVAAVQIDHSVRGLFAARSGLALVRWSPFSPVCLKMGAALTAIQARDEWALTVTWRRNAMSENAAKSLLESMIAAL